ncbi:MAG: pentapeptide repeat-containing protein [Elusimicrobia bacterium]|nr:pentapeptide repeat-containing protein [Elusimicrobiota bacterium]
MGLKASDLSSGYARRSLGGLFGYPTRTDLSSVDLSGSDFGDGPGKSKLRGVNFTGANLQGARFHLADLTDALLVNANLSGANFHHAILMGADLTGARLDGADLEGAWFDKETKLPFPGSPADRRKKGEELGMQYESYERQPHGHDGDERPPRNTGGFGHFGM